MQQLPLHLLLLRSQAAMHREIMAEAARLKLSPGQPKILEYLLQTGESNQKAIALHCEIEPATVGSILTRMERDGLIARAQHAGNRRSLVCDADGKRSGTLPVQWTRRFARPTAKRWRVCLPHSSRSCAVCCSMSVMP